MVFFARLKTALGKWASSQRLRYRIQRVLILGILINLLFGQLFYLAERGGKPELTLSDSYWWTFVTATTVGYGDHYPDTNIGRYLVAVPLMIIGIGLVGSLIGLVTEAAIELSTRKRKGHMKVKCTNHVIICNYPGHQKLLGIAGEMRALPDHEETDIVLITESFDTLPVDLADKGFKFVRGNCTQEDVLEQANVLECAGVLILAKDAADIRSDERSFAIATVIENMSAQTGKEVITTVELVSPKNLSMMKRSGVDRIVSTTGIGSSLLVQEFMHAGMQGIFSELASNVGGHRFTIIHPAAGKTLRDYQRHALDNNLKFQIVGIVRAESNDLTTDRDAKITEGDDIMILATERTAPEEIEKALTF